MGILTRLYNLLRSNMNSWLDEVEDPEKLMNTMIEDLEKRKRQAKEQVATALADQKRLEAMIDKSHQETQRWEANAIKAVRNNNDDLARQALLEKKKHEQRMQELQQQHASHKQNTNALKEAYSALENKITEIKNKRNILIAKHRQAKTQQKIQETIQGLGSNGTTMQTLESLEERIQDMEAKASAYQELHDETTGQSLEEAIQALGEGETEVDQELLEIKKRALLEQ